VTIVVNHLHLREPVQEGTLETAREVVQHVVDAGALEARVVRVDDTHLIMVLEFAGPEDADRIARDVGGAWMREHILPLLEGGPERSVGEVIAAAKA
jgi:hypothetical protein